VQDYFNFKAKYGYFCSQKDANLHPQDPGNGVLTGRFQFFLGG
jgi:hypothetical protein